MGRLSPADFHAVYGFRRPDVAFGGLTPGLRSGLSLHPPPENPELRCCPSRLYTFRLEYMAGLGSGLPFEVSPNLSSSALSYSRYGTLPDFTYPFPHVEVAVKPECSGWLSCLSCFSWAA